MCPYCEGYVDDDGHCPYCGQYIDDQADDGPPPIDPWEGEKAEGEAWSGEWQ